MFDLYINPATGDLDFQNGGLSLVQDTNKRVRQELEVTLRAFKGEWFNNVQFGGINRDYIAQPGITKLEMDAWYRRTILSNPEVLELVFFESKYNRNSRQYDLEFVVRTASGSERGRVGVRPDKEIEYVLPPQTEYQPPTTPSIKVMSAFISGLSNVTAIMTKDAISFVPFPITGTSSVTATAVRNLQAVTITGTGNITTGNINKPMAATISGSGAISALAGTVMAASISGSGAISGSVYKPLAATLNNIGNVNASIQKAVSASISGSDTVTANVSYGGTVTISGTSAVVASLVKNMMATVTGSSTVAAGAARAISATIAGNDSVIAAFNKRLTASMSGSTGIVATIQKSSGTLVLAGTSNVSASITKRLSATITSTNAITAAINKGGMANISGTSTVSAQPVKVKYASSVITGTSNVVANFTKVKQGNAVITGTSTVSGTGTRRFQLNTLTGTSTTSGTIRKRLIGTISGSGNVTGSVAKRAIASLSGTGNVTGNITKNKIMSATISGTSTTSGYILKGENLGPYDILLLSYGPEMHIPLQETGAATNGRQLRVLPEGAVSGAQITTSTITLASDPILRDPSRSFLSGLNGCDISLNNYGLANGVGNTFIFWIKPGTSGQVYYNVGVDVTRVPKFRIGRNDTGQVTINFTHTSGAPATTKSITATTNNAIAMGTNCMLAVTLDLSGSLPLGSIKVFFNGVQQSYSYQNITGWTYVPSWYTDRLSVLNSAGITNIERVSTFDLVLTPTQITDLYNAGVR